MKVKMKRCINCKTLFSNSSKSCTKCGSKELEKGFYTDESNKSVIYNKHLHEVKNDICICPTCGTPIIFKDGQGECIECEEKIITISNNNYLYRD